VAPGPLVRIPSPPSAVLGCPAQRIRVTVQPEPAPRSLARRSRSLGSPRSCRLARGSALA